jgi:hypothetical protein
MGCLRYGGHIVLRAAAWMATRFAAASTIYYNYSKSAAATRRSAPVRAIGEAEALRFALLRAESIELS